MQVSEGRSLSFITSDGLTLEAVLHLPDALPALGLVVCHPHPQYGGDMRNNVVATLCQTAVDNGIAALRFNFRGVGASEGTHDKGRRERSDVAAALAWLRTLPEIDRERTGLAGYSFGAAVALGAADPETHALIAVSTPTIGDTISQIAVDCPLLLVSGDRDEYSDAAALARLAEPLGDRTEVAILPGVDHFWWGSDDRLTGVVSEFLNRTLAPPTRASA